ncbi:universal stress protein [Kribbella sp. NBC_01245]|uniref:universal stress protein n=1 Tax=Kribbella sp. NBC_01245 TaxID=2903578 RepID=UPI002E2DE3C8|nr:universal stress protein [Kribbella sp. NBC_01245]
MRSQIAPVVAGYDGSPVSRGALHWAAVEAVSTGLPLRIVEVFELVITTHPSPGAVVPLEGLRTARQKGLDAIIEDLRLHHPGLDVTGALLTGTPAATLIEESEHARMLVLGTRGLGALTSLLLGSVSIQVSAHARCPVVVVRPESPAPTPEPVILVGVDGSKVSADAIDFAFAEASARHGRIVAVHAWTSPVTSPEGEPTPLLFDLDEIEKAARLLVAESLAGARADYPDVDVEIRLVMGRPDRILVEQGYTADLIVVGSRGRGGFTGLLVGSVAHAVLHHADRPVALVR